MSDDIYLIPITGRTKHMFVFKFHGGPFDGQSLVVDMIETTRGLIAPEEVKLLVVKTKFGALAKVVPSDQFDESEAAYGKVEVYRFDGEGYVWSG